MDKILMFMLGAGIGSLVTWKFVEQKYKKIADEEIESVIEHCKNKEKHFKDVMKYPWGSKEYVENLDTEEKEEYINTVNEYENIINEQGYNKESDDIEPEEHIKPYIISPEEFGEFGNSMHSWTYYADFVLTDIKGDVVIDPEQYIGDALQHFGKYEEDSIHVRNEDLEWDIEIIKSDLKFTDINKPDPDLKYNETLNEIAEVK